MDISYYYLREKKYGKKWVYSIRRKILRSAISVDRLMDVDTEEEAQSEIDRLQKNNIVRDYSFIRDYYSELLEDIYPQPPDDGHTKMAQDVIDDWIPETGGAVLDVGCGEAFTQPMFEEKGWKYVGVCLGDDYDNAIERGLNVRQYDFHFLPYQDEQFDLVFSRHALEHSPMPLFALMEWHRVAKEWLVLVLPNPEYWGTAGRNHYSVMDENQALFLLDRAGWKILWDNHGELELKFLCQKVARKNPYHVEINKDENPNTK